MADDDTDDRDAISPVAAADTRVLPARELFGDRNEVWLDLDGVRYRLRITRRGKLILQK